MSVDPELEKLKEMRDRVRSSCSEPLSVVVFSLRSEGFTIREITKLRVSDIHKADLPDEVKRDIHEYIHGTMEYRILEIIVRDGPIGLTNIGQQMSMRSMSSLTNIHNNYLKRLVRKKAVIKDGTIYRSTQKRMDRYIEALYLTRFREDKPSSRESLYGYFREAIRSVNDTACQ